MSVFGDFMIDGAARKDAEIARLRDALEVEHGYVIRLEVELENAKKLLLRARTDCPDQMCDRLDLCSLCKDIDRFFKDVASKDPICHRKS